MKSRIVVMASTVFLIAGWAIAGESYRKPPADIVKILEAAPLPMVTINPGRTHLLQLERENLPPLEDLTQPMWRLAGHRINPKTNGRHGVRRFVGLSLRGVTDGTEARVSLPQPANVGFPSWSPDGKRFAFTLTLEAGVQLWVGETATAKAWAVTGPNVNAAMFGAFTWMPDSRRLLCRMVPSDRGASPTETRVPEGPVVLSSTGRVAPVRTFQDMLKNPHDEALFDHVMTAQLTLFDATTGTSETIGDPAIFDRIDPAPNGKHLLVSRIGRPYSYLVGSRSFPETVEVWNLKGEVVQKVAKLPLRDDVPIQGVPVGPRSFSWRSTSPATLVWVEALDGGNPKKKAEHRDRVMTVAAPFPSEAKEVFRIEHRFRGLTWLEEGAHALMSEYDRDRRWERHWLIDFADHGKLPRLVWDRSAQDRYGDPGDPVMTLASSGHPVALVHENGIYLKGRGASPDGERPFLDRMDLATFATERLWHCGPGSYESVTALFNDDATNLLTRFETEADPPNYFVRNLLTKTKKKITDFEDPAPQFAGTGKELLTYQREDGVGLSGTLYLPANREEGERLPLLIWAYPREFNESRTAGQVRGSQHRFTRPSGTSHLFLLTQGYAVLDGASMPVVGDPETANNTFREQIVANAQAAIDKVVEMGVADPSRVGIGGHSYGAFMTGNLLAHCDLFAAGIARSGAYNRTLTPFGFQNERRTLWEAPMTYFTMSPFMHADKIDEPILLIHGQNDNNSGTFPIQSERFYHGLKGHGKTARLVMLPFESHGYRAKESVLHVLAEMVDWMDKHVKNRSASGF